MRKFLAHDEQTRELRLVYTDLWEGQHERTEYRVVPARGAEPVHDMPGWDGMPVYGSVPGLYIKVPGGQTAVFTEEVAVGPTVKTTCPKATNRRRKCALCAVQ